MRNDSCHRRALEGGPHPQTDPVTSCHPPPIPKGPSPSLETLCSPQRGLQSPSLPHTETVYRLSNLTTLWGIYLFVPMTPMYMILNCVHL